MAQAYMIVTTILLMLLIIVVAYTIVRDIRQQRDMFNIQMAGAQSRQRPEIHKLSYQELIKVINGIIDFYTTKNMDILANSNKSDDEISILLDDMVIDVSTKVRTSISQEITECMLCYTTEDYYNRYIINSVRFLIIASIEKTRGSRRRKLPKEPTDEKQ